MGQVKLHVSMSLDGFTAGAGVSVEHPMGMGGLRLHEWLFADRMDPVDAEVARAMFARDEVGAVLMGRRHFDVGIADWGDDGTFGMPCFVVTHRPADRLVKGPTTFEFLTGGPERALETARASAGDMDVNIMGADLTRQLLRAGLIDEIEINLVPIVLGAGASLFGGLEPEEITLRQIAVRPASAVTHLRYGVVKSPRVTSRPS
jgi:dihydrofolate reductase